MSKGAQHTLVHSPSLKDKNIYVKAMYTTYKDWVLDEEDALSFKGQCRKTIFKNICHSRVRGNPATQADYHLSKEGHSRVRGNPAVGDTALDVEIGPGNGEHFAYLAENHPDKFYLAIELKYKPIIQTARRLKTKQLNNAKVIRYNACLINNIFAANEIDNVYIYFPDPWPKKRHHKHRLINKEFLQRLHNVQKTGSFVEIKTDDRAYFTEMQVLFKASSYKLAACDENIHKHKEDQKNKSYFMTFFERIFVRKNQPVYYAKYLC